MAYQNRERRTALPVIFICVWVLISNYPLNPMSAGQCSVRLCIALPHLFLFEEAVIIKYRTNHNITSAPSITFVLTFFCNKSQFGFLSVRLWASLPNR